MQRVERRREGEELGKTNVDNLVTKIGCEVGVGKGVVYFSVIEDPNDDKVKNAEEKRSN